jgi:tetratricopeptide (TPR) repeat protein
MLERNNLHPVADPYPRLERFRPLSEIYCELGQTLLDSGYRLRDVGQTEHARNYFADAAQAFEDALHEQSEPEPRAVLYLYLAHARQTLKRPVEAIQACLEAVGLSPAYTIEALTKAHRFLSREVTRFLGDVEQQLRPLAESGTISVEAETYLYNFLGRVSLYRDEYSRAITHFKQALVRNPRNVYALEGLGEVYWRQGQVERAAEILDQAVRQADQDGDPERRAAARLKRVKVLLDAGRPQEAVPLIEQGRTLDTALEPDFLVRLGQCQVALGQPKLALQWIDRALAGSAVPAWLRVQAVTVRAAAYRDLGKYSQAVQAAEEALRLDSTYLPVVAIQAESRIHGGIEPDVGIRLLQLYTVQKPADLDRQRLLIRALRDQGRPATEVIETLRRAVAAAPVLDQGPLQVELADAYLQAGKPDEALAVLDEVAQRDSSQRSTPWWRLRGDARRRLGQPTAATESYREGLRRDPNDTGLLRHYADLLLGLEDYMGAVQAWRSLIAHTPQDGSAHLALSRALHGQGDLQTALTEVDQALALDLAFEPKIAAFKLKAEILRGLDRPAADQAAAYFEAGRITYDEHFTVENAAKAVALFEEANRLNPDHLLTYWYLADALLVDSYTNEPPQVKEEPIGRSREVWDRGAARAAEISAHETAPATPHSFLASWAYITRARISSQLALVPKANRWDWYWEGLVYLERGLLVNNYGTQRWALLANLHRTLENNYCARRASAQALDYGQEAVEALDERAAILANLGEWKEAETTIDKRRSLQPHPWADGTKAFILAGKKQYPAALELITQVAQVTPEDLWTRLLLAYCYRRLGRWAEARGEYRWVWEQRQDPRYANFQSSFAQAGYALATLEPDDGPAASWQVQMDELNETIALYNNMLDRLDSPIERPNNHRSLGCCYLARGDWAQGDRKKAEDHLVTGIRQARRIPALDWIYEDFADLRQASKFWSHGQVIRDVLQGLEERIHEKRDELKHALTPSQELESILETQGRFGKKTYAWLGAQAGLARLYTEQKRWRDAAAKYQLLLQASEHPLPAEAGLPPFPEARIGLQKAFDEIQAEADRLWREGKPRAPLSRYQQLEQLDGLATDQKRQAGLHSRLGLVYAMRKKMSDARSHFLGAMRSYQEAGSSDPGGALGEVCSSLIPDATRLWPLRALWKSLADEYTLDPMLQCNFLSARASLANYLFEHIQAEGDQYLREGRPEDALERYQHLHELEELAGDPSRQAGLHGRRGMAHFLQTDLMAARTHFVTAIELYRQSGAPEPGGALGSLCRSLLRDVLQFWALDSEWITLAAEAGGDLMLRHDLAAAQNELGGYLDELYQLANEAEPAEALRPIVLELGRGLIPSDADENWRSWSLFRIYIPEMKERIKTQMGLEMPGVLVRGNNALAEAEYVIQLDEVPLVRSSVPLGVRYALAAKSTLQELGIPPHAVTEMLHPLTGEPGCWVAAEFWEQVAGGGVELLAEPLVNVMLHLEAILCRNLANFLGVQEAKNLLTTWEKREGGATQTRMALPEPSSQLCFTRLLRTLVKERVPLTAPEEILQAVQEHRTLDDLASLVRAVRLRLKRQLPGNTPDARRYELPAHWEATIAGWLRHVDGRTAFVPPPDQAHELLRTIRAWWPPPVGNAVLITRHPGLRPYVRRLVEFEFPDLLVLSSDELLGPDELQASGPETVGTQAEGGQPHG